MEPVCQSLFIYSKTILIMSIITIFDYCKNPKSCLPLLSILNQIKSGKYKREVENLRKYYEADIGTEYDQQQKIIPQFSVAGNFRMEEEQLKMISYSGNLLLEIPYLNMRDLKIVKMLLANDPCVMTCFEDALGNGLVFIVRSNGIPEEHQLMFRLAVRYYKNLTGIARFSSEGKSLIHTCMVSVDEHTYISLEAKSFSKHIKAKAI
jgi:hypothetical protein